MKLNNLVFDFDKFAAEMAKLRNEKHFDYLVTIIGEDFGEPLVIIVESDGNCYVCLLSDIL